MNFSLSNMLIREGLIIIGFIVSLIAVYFIYDKVLKILRKKASQTENIIDDFIIDIFRVPVLWLLFWVLFKIFSYFFFEGMKIANTLSHINIILLILSIAWILTKVSKTLAYYIERKQAINAPDNFRARSNLTEMKVFENIANIFIWLIAVSISLMTFEGVRTVGASLLTSAGIAGIILGFAAQKSISTFFSGIQIAITQPIKLDDTVAVEGEFGSIEEITLTYVVVKLWDERRLILPVSYFLENPIQNFSRNTTNIMNTVFLYVDYSLPIDPLRKYFMEIVNSHPKWDKRVANIQVSDSKSNYIELRVLLSSKDSSASWDLRVDVREKLINFINTKYPNCFVKTRIEEIKSLSIKDD